MKFNLGSSIDLVIVEDDKLQELISELLESNVEESSNYDGLDNVDLEDIDIEVIEDSEDEDPEEGVDDTPITSNSSTRYCWMPSNSAFPISI